MPRKAVQLASLQIVQRMSVVQQIRPTRRAEMEGEVSPGREAETLGVAAKEGRKDGQAAADDASAYFGSAARGQREETILKNQAELPECVDRENKPSDVYDRELLGTVSETKKRACNSATESTIRQKAFIQTLIYSHDSYHKDCTDSDLSLD